MKLSDHPTSVGELFDKTVHTTVLNALPLFTISSMAVMLAVVFRILMSMESTAPTGPSPVGFILPAWSLPAWFGFLAQFALYSLALSALLIKLDASQHGLSLSAIAAYVAAFGRWPAATVGLGVCLAVAYMTFVALSLGLGMFFGVLSFLAVGGHYFERGYVVFTVLMSVVLTAIAASIATRFVIASVMCAVAIVLDKAALVQAIFFGMRTVASAGGFFWRTLGAGAALAAMLVLVSVGANAIAAFVPARISTIVAFSLESLGYLVLTTLIAVFAILFYRDLQLRGASIDKPRLRFDLHPQVHAALGERDRNRERD
jgi:hypothetical protein